MTTPTEGSGTAPQAFPEVRSETSGVADSRPETASGVQNARSSRSPSRVVGIALAAVCGVAVGYFAKPAPKPETRFLNFDAESTPEDTLAHGWSSFEMTQATGDTFVWCAGRSCSVRVWSRADGDRFVRVRLSAFKFPDAPAQTVTAFVNETPIGTQPVAGAMSIVSFRAPRAAWRNGANEVRFDFAYAADPKSKFPSADDTRQLSAAFDWLEITNAAQ
jgi:hypothetical protein